MVIVRATLESLIRFNAKRGEYGPGNMEDQVAERLRPACSLKAHYTDRARPDGQILAVRSEPLPRHGFVTLYINITASCRFKDQILQEKSRA